MNEKIISKEMSWLLEEKYNGEKCEEFFSDVKKLKTGYPLAYLIGFVDFINTKIDLEFKPLIPRPETEFWIYEYIFPKIKEEKSIASQNYPIKVLDIFSGSGCIGLSLLNNFNNVEVDFGEIKIENILQIKKNIKINNLELSVIPQNDGYKKILSNNQTNNKRFQIFQSDIFLKIPEKKYDFILANPPYISLEKKEEPHTQKSVLKNEDSLALFAEDNGLFFVKKLILEGLKYLSENGELWIEYDPWQTDLIREFLKENNIINYKVNSEQCAGREGALEYNIKRDQYGLDRFLKIKKNIL